jgi:hypothetical protein
MPSKTRILPKPKLEEVLADKHTKMAFEHLISRNASPEGLWTHLQPAIVAAFIPRSGGDMLSVGGMTRRQLAGVPASIRKMAGCIRLIEENPQLESAGPMKISVSLLVKLLIQYADRLESDIKYYRKFMAKNPSYWNLKSRFLLKLLDYVNKTTGKPHFEKVSTLLVGGLAAADQEAIVDVDPDSLRKLFRRRSPKKITRVD